jgi:DHA2 family multidrug resistance protein
MGASEFVNQVISSQSSTLGVNDVFNLMGLIFVALIPIIWFAKPPFGARAATPAR